MANEENTLNTPEMFKLILERLNSIDVRQNTFEQDSRAMQQGIINLSTRMEAVETKVDAMEKAAQESRQAISPALERLERKTDGIQTVLNEFRLETIRHLRAIDRRLDVFTIDLSKIHADMREFDLRLADVESKIT